MTSLNLIFAVSEFGDFGCRQRLPWHLPEDLKRFKSLTGKSPLIMGRHTFESLPRKLPERDHIVISSRHVPHADACVDSLESAMSSDCVVSASEAFVIGGASLILEASKIASTAFITRLKGHYESDVRLDLSKLDCLQDRNGWTLVHSESLTSSNGILYDNLVFVRS